MLRRGCLLTQAEGGPKFRGSQEGEKLHESWVIKHYVLNGPWGQAVELIVYEAETRNLEHPCLSL